MPVIKTKPLTTFSVVLVILSLIVSFSFSQKVTKTQKSENIALTRKVCEIKEIKELILTKDYNGKEGVFVKLDTAFFDREVFDKESATPFYIWNKSTLFFHKIEHSLAPISIERKGNKIYYKFMTFSLGKDNKSEYHKGQVVFVKSDNDWKVKKYKIKKTKYIPEKDIKYRAPKN